MPTQPNTPQNNIVAPMNVPTEAALASMVSIVGSPAGTRVVALDTGSDYAWFPPDVAVPSGLSTVPGPVSGSFVKRSVASSTSLAGLQSNKNIMLVGDSITKGSGAARYSGGYRNVLYTLLRRVRADFTFIGTQIEFQQGAQSLGYWRHQGTTSSKIEDITASYASFVASQGQPDIVRVLIGVNNVTAGDTVAQMQTKYLAMIAQIQATSPSARIMCVAILPLFAGTSTGGSLAAYEAVRIAFNTWLTGTFPTLAAVNGSNVPVTVTTQTGATMRYVIAQPALSVSVLDYTSQLFQGDVQADGVHPNLSGCGRMGEAEQDGLTLILPSPTGLTVPRYFTQRPVPTTLANLNCVAVQNSGTDGITITNPPNLNPGTTDLAVSFNYLPTALPGTPQAGGFQSMVQYGRLANQPNFYVVAQRGSSIIVNFSGGVGPNSNGVISDLAVSGVNPPNANALVVGQWVHVLFIIKQRAGGTSDAALYINGQLANYQSNTGSGTWTFTQQNFIIGASPDFNGALGYYDNIKHYKGASVPTPGTLACNAFAEAEHFENANLPGMTAQYEMQEGTGTTVSSTINGDPVGNFAGGSTTAWASSVHPWDYGFVPTPSLRQTVVLADASATITPIDGQHNTYDITPTIGRTLTLVKPSLAGTRVAISNSGSVDVTMAYSGGGAPVTAARQSYIQGMASIDLVFNGTNWVVMHAQVQRVSAALVAGVSALIPCDMVGGDNVTLGLLTWNGASGVPQVFGIVAGTKAGGGGFQIKSVTQAGGANVGTDIGTYMAHIQH